MRNLVAKNDHNRASVHTDQKKAWEPDILDGLEEHYLEIEPQEEEVFDPQAIALAEYSRGIKDSRIVS